MAKGFTGTGGVLLGLGIVLMIVCALIIGISLGTGTRERTMADEGDLVGSGADYSATIEDDYMTTLNVRMSSVNGSIIEFDIVIVDNDGTELMSDSDSTPFEKDISVNGATEVEISIHFRTTNVTQSSIDLRIRALEITRSALVACCSASAFSLLGALLILAGGIMLIIGLASRSGKKKKNASMAKPPVTEETWGKEEPMAELSPTEVQIPPQQPNEGLDEPPRS